MINNMHATGFNNWGTMLMFAVCTFVWLIILRSLLHLHEYNEHYKFMEYKV